VICVLFGFLKRKKTAFEGMIFEVDTSTIVEKDIEKFMDMLADLLDKGETFVINKPIRRVV
jgi:excinuclease UvrABC ATPase subunit